MSLELVKDTLLSHNAVGLTGAEVAYAPDYSQSLLVGAGVLAEVNTLQRAQARIRRVARVGLAHFSSGEYQEAFECGVAARQLLDLCRGFREDRGGVLPEMGDVSTLLTLCRLLTQPYELTVTTDEAGDVTRVSAIVRLPELCRRRRIITKYVPSAIHPQSCVFLAEWPGGNCKSYRKADLVTAISLNEFSLPSNVPHCGFRIYREGQLFGSWRLVRECRHGERTWRLTVY